MSQPNTAPIAPSATTLPAAGPTSVRWMIVALLVAFSIVSYVERMNISVAAKFMMPELGLSEAEMGRIFSVFLLGYSLLQIPFGMLGDRLGTSRLLVALGASWAVLTAATGYLPGRWAVPLLGVFGTLVAIRFLLGVAIAGVYPLAARTMARWQPVTRRAFAYSLVIAGVSIGSAVTPPAIAWLMLHAGWRDSFYWAALPSIAIAILWSWLGGDEPESHAAVNEAERRLIISGRGDESSHVHRPRRADWWRTLRNRSVLTLCASYFLAGYVLYTFVFWFYLYLVDVRHFSVLAGGGFASLPFVAAGVLSPAGGIVCDRATARMGRLWGRRLTGIVGPLAAAVCLLVGSRTGHAYFAVAALSLSFGFQMFAESATWSTAMDVGGRLTGMTTGIVNTANNLGGVVSTSLMPLLVARFGWVSALDSCACVAAVGALLWLGVRPDQPVELDAKI